MRRLWFCFDSTTEKNRSFFKFPSNIQTREYFKTFLQATNLMMNRYYVTSNESTSKNAGSFFFSSFLFFYQYQWVGNWKLEARIPINIFCLNFVSIVWTSNEIKYCPALTMNVKNNRGWCRNFKLDLMKSTTNISVNFSMGMNGIVIFMYRMVQWIYIKKCDKVFEL